MLKLLIIVLCESLDFEDFVDEFEDNPYDESDDDPEHVLKSSELS